MHIIPDDDSRHDLDQAAALGGEPVADAALADALFASALQRSDYPSAAQIRQAVTRSTRAFGDLGCAAQVAQEFGEHPETAVMRMRCARLAVAGAFDGPGAYATAQAEAGIRSQVRETTGTRPW